MQLQSATSFSERPSSDVLILPFWHDDKAEPACKQTEFRSDCALAGEDFKGKEGETLFLYRKGKKENRILLLGLGKKEACTLETIRKAYAAALKSCRHKKLTHLCAALPQIDLPVAYAAAEGLMLMNYAFDQLKCDVLKDDPPVLVEDICFIGINEKTFAQCCDAQIVINAVNYARDLINGNADDVTPQMLAHTAKDLALDHKKIRTTVLDKTEITRAQMGLLLAVNRGSFRDPAFIIIEYQGDPKSSTTTALVGKGITYDTGGLNLKPTGSMETMKDDMSGAAAVLGTIKAAAELGLKVNLIGIIASTENSIGSKSYKPGDVYKSYSGKTVEISNTDAEGRLVLADAVSYVQDNFKPTRIIDLATLTGGIVIALGEEASGLFSNNDKLAAAIMKAGENTHERVWRLPLYPEYREALKSQIADIKNSADRKASPITGAIFIQEFIKKTPWVHLDIAGTAFLTSPRHYHATNATGVGVRLLIDFLKSEEDR
jgi:leucyl aminopeptidase